MHDGRASGPISPTILPIRYTAKALMINVFLSLVAGYMLVGVLAGAWLAWVGIGRIDPAAAKSPWHFRLMILPGLVGLWPLMLVKWARAEKGGGA